MTNVDYAKLACKTLMDKFQAQDLPPINHFHYHQGVFLLGMYQLYKITKDEKYLNYIKKYYDSLIDDNGFIQSVDPTSMDDIQPGILLFPLYDIYKDEKYKKALDLLANYMHKYPTTSEGCLFHKGRHPNQMWLDGIYMGGPFCSEYGIRYNDDSLIQLILKQAYLIEKHNKDPKTGLFYHACDVSKVEKWADKITGCSPCFWGRAIGWVNIGILDEINNLKGNPTYKNDVEKLKNIVKNLLISICKYQSEDGRYYQVVDKGENADNWLETSCSCLFVAAIFRAIKENILDKSYLKYAKKGYEGVINSLNIFDDKIEINNVCIGTGVGDYSHYINRPTSINDLHGVGAFLFMCNSYFD